MNRRQGWILVALSIPLLAITSPGGAAPNEASSRVRNIKGKIETTVPASAESVLVDSITVIAFRNGWELLSSDKQTLRVRFEKPATAAEVATLVSTVDGNELKRVGFEVVTNKKKPETLKVIGVMLVVADAGSVGQSDVDVGKRQPFRNELKALLAEIKATFEPVKP